MARVLPLRERLEAGQAVHGLVIRADEQLAGRDRREKNWASAPGGSYQSFAVTDLWDGALRTPVLTLELATALAEELREAGARASVKWPNDILLDDADFAEVFRSQDGVDSFLHHQSRDKSTVLLARRFEEVEADESAEEPNAERIARWYLLALDGAADETLVVENACSMRVMDGVSGRELIYSDCSSGDLLWYSFENEETKLLASKVKAYRVMGNAADGPILMYLERDDSDDSNTGPLYARWGFESPSFLGEGGNLKLSWVSSSGTQRPVVDWKDGTGTLKYGSVGKKLETLAKGVVHVSSAGVISEYDGENGVFSRLSGNELTKVHERVHADGMRADANADRVLLLTDYDDGYGSLVLVSGEQHQLLAKTVQPNAYQYAVSFPMVSVLNDYDAKTGTATLRMVRTDRDQDLEIASGVRESLEIGWPKQGLLFSAPSADPPGIYFARAR